MKATRAPGVRGPAPRRHTLPTVATPHVLYLHGNAEDYLGDSVLHGLRLLLGDRVVDVPRRDALYADLPAPRRHALYGRGFTLYARLGDVDVDRSRWLARVLEGEFDVVVFGDIWRYWAPWLQLRPHVRRLRELGVQLVALDGGDGPVLFPHGPSWWRQMRPWPLPRVVGRAAVFKRELSPVTARVRGYGLPARLVERTLLRDVRPIGFSIPEEHLAGGGETKERLLARHVVDPAVRALWPAARGDYSFDDEADYFADLRASRFGITMRKAGWETLRHYELAASGCVPCFRDLAAKPERSAPFGLHEGNCVPYTDADALLSELESMDDARYERLRAGALEWARRNTTRVRARELLDAAGRPVTDGSAPAPADRAG
jgi:hypothetical protein